MTYLERYLNGECEMVWHELQQLGSSVREEPVYSDALAVAQETMSRVRQNIETLIVRLIELGFLFGYDHHLLNVLKNPRTHATDYMQRRAWVQEQPPVFLDAHLEDRRTALDTIDPFLPDWEEQVHAFEQQVRSRSIAFLETLERAIGPMPLSVHAWYGEIGAVNFYGYFAPWDELIRSTSSFPPPRFGAFTPSALMQYCDPLQVRPLNESALQRLKAALQVSKTGRVAFEFADDCYGKDYASGSPSQYLFWFPDASADANDAYGMTFVEYLRFSLLQWAGFPQMVEWLVKPEKDLLLLTQGLLPF